MGFKKFVVVSLLIAGLALPAQAAAEAKIGVIDFQKVLEASKAGKSAQEEISAQGRKMESDLKDRSDEIKELETKLERESMVMDSAVKEEKKREVRIKINDIKTLQKKYVSDFKRMEAQVINEIQKDVFKVVAEIGQQEKYTLILEKQAGGVVYLSEAEDITTKVIEKYDVVFDKKSASQ